MGKPFPDGDYICADCEIGKHRPRLAKVLNFPRQSQPILSAELEFYQRQLQGRRCRWCEALLDRERLQCYDHHGGYSVEGFAEKQWLYVVCPNCRYQWSAWKLELTERKPDESC